MDDKLVTGGRSAAKAVSVVGALSDLARNAQRPARLPICGSLYFAGQVLAEDG